VPCDGAERLTAGAEDLELEDSHESRPERQLTSRGVPDPARHKLPVPVGLPWIDLPPTRRGARAAECVVEEKVRDAAGGVTEAEPLKEMSGKDREAITKARHWTSDPPEYGRPCSVS
jgi:hypothetical protein